VITAEGRHKMPRRDPDTDPRAFLGRELARARKAAGFSQDTLSVRLVCDRTVVAKIETGDRVPTDEVLEAWCAACNLDPEMFARWSTFARRTDGPVPSWFESWLEAEKLAHMLRIWQPLVIPGLFQTAEYARALFIAAGADVDRADDLVRVRLGRQDILDRQDPPHVVAVLDELAVRRLVGSPAIMAEQLDRVADLAERANITIQVVPSETGANAGLSGCFDMASGDGTPEVLRMEAVEDLTVESRALVRQAVDIFTRVQADALPRTASLKMIREAAETWKAQ